MDYRLKLFILACTITGSLSLLCEHCYENLFGAMQDTPYNCSAPTILNCTVDDNCDQGSPNYDNCTRDTILACMKGSFLYTDNNGTLQSGQIKGCSYPSSSDALACSQQSCNEAAAGFNQTNITGTFISCAVDCCFNDSCNQGAAPSLPSAAPSTIIVSTNTPMPTNTSMLVSTGPSPSMTSPGAPAPMVQVSCPHFVGLVWLAVVSLL